MTRPRTNGANAQTCRPREPGCPVPQSMENFMSLEVGPIPNLRSQPSRSTTQRRPRGGSEPICPPLEGCSRLPRLTEKYTPSAVSQRIWGPFWRRSKSTIRGRTLGHGKRICRIRDRAWRLSPSTERFTLSAARRRFRDLCCPWLKNTIREPIHGGPRRICRRDAPDLRHRRSMTGFTPSEEPHSFKVPECETVEEYNPATDQWAPKLDMPTARVFLQSGEVDGKIYVLGGVVANIGPEVLTTVEEYDAGVVSTAVKPTLKVASVWGTIKKD